MCHLAARCHRLITLQSAGRMRNLSAGHVMTKKWAQQVSLLQSIILNTEINREPLAE